MLEAMDAKVAAPPNIFDSILNGVRVVSKAIVPNTVNICLKWKMSNSNKFSDFKSQLP
jgi:hypothetical protein